MTKLEAATMILVLPSRMDAATGDLERAAVARVASRCARALGWGVDAAAFDEDAARYERCHARAVEERTCTAPGGSD